MTENKINNTAEPTEDNGKMFNNIKIPAAARKKSVDIDLNALYERANAELGLQQTKRDQIITIYLAMFSFLIPFALSMEQITWQIKGLIFLATAIIGVLFANIIIRYRIYKEAYWLCCQTITVLFGIKSTMFNKKVIQKCYYDTIKKKGSKFFVNEKFSKKLYIKKNLFSSESIYFFVHTFITSLIFGLSVALIINSGIIVSAIVGTLAGIVVFLLLSKTYFQECIKVYGVLIDGSDKSFNFAFEKAWFLHFYMDEDKNGESENNEDKNSKEKVK